MTDQEESHIHFTVNAFAELSEELGIDVVFEMFLKKVRIYKAIPKNIECVVAALKATEHIQVVLFHRYLQLINNMLDESAEVNEIIEEGNDDVLITDEETPDGQQVH